MDATTGSWKAKGARSARTASSPWMAAALPVRTCWPVVGARSSPRLVQTLPISWVVALWAELVRDRQRPAAEAESSSFSVDMGFSKKGCARGARVAPAAGRRAHLGSKAGNAWDGAWSDASRPGPKLIRNADLGGENWPIRSVFRAPSNGPAAGSAPLGVSPHGTNPPRPAVWGGAYALQRLAYFRRRWQAAHRSSTASRSPGARRRPRVPRPRSPRGRSPRPRRRPPRRRDRRVRSAPPAEGS